MATARETVLVALLNRLATLQGPTVKRNEPFPEKIPAGGLIILSDGESGDPEVTLSPVSYLWTHMALIDVAVQNADQETRDAALDDLLQAISAVLASEPTLGGVCDRAQMQAPNPELSPVVGAGSIKAAACPVELIYSSADPIG